MPELPEVETVCRTLAPHIEGKYLLSFEEVRSPCLVAESLPVTAARDVRVAQVFRRGKFVACRLEGTGQGKDAAAEPARELFWITHLRMTGTLMAYDRDSLDSEAAACGRHTRAVLTFADTPAGPCSCRVVFNDMRTFGRMFLGSRAALEAWSSWANLGPEPLTMGEQAFVQAMRGTRAIKAVLLDQHVLAGIGNIYADESLFAAGIDPRRPADSLSRQEKVRLHGKVVELLELSIRECGSSIRNYQDANGNVGAFQNHFAVYGRGGESCPVCGSVLQKITVAGRGTVVCPRCQKAGR